MIVPVDEASVTVEAPVEVVLVATDPVEVSTVVSSDELPALAVEVALEAALEVAETLKPGRKSGEYVAVPEY